MLISCAGFALAQDILSLRGSGETIENVKVVAITDSTISYVQNGVTQSVPRNKVEAILYADGRYETIKMSIVGDETVISNAESLGYDAKELQTLLSNGEDRKMLLWQDKHYSKECRKVGKTVYYKVFNSLYAPTLKQLKKDGMKHYEAVQQAMQTTLEQAMKESNEALRECNGGM